MLLFCDGFDRYSTIADTSAKGWVVSNQGAGSWTYQPAAGVNGGGALRIEQDDQGAERRVRDVNPGLDYIRFAFWLKSAGTPGGEDAVFFLIDSGAILYGGAKVTNAGELSFINSTSGSPNPNSASVFISSGANLHDGNFHFIECYYKSGNGTAGAIKVKVDNNVVLDISGIDNCAGATATMNVDVIRLYGIDTSADFDDVFVWDDEVGPGLTGELGGVRVISTTSPNGAGALTQLTPNTGANYAAVDDSPFHDSDTTYVEGDTTGEKDLYTVGALPLTPVSIDCTVINAVVKTVAGAECQAKLAMRSVSADVDSADIAFSNSGYKTIQAAFEEDPNASAAWTESTLNAAQIGIEMVS